MRAPATLAVALTVVVGLACEGDSLEEPTSTTSRLDVYVHWDDVGLPEKRVEVVELGAERLTDESGIAEFVIPAGTYTVRAYDINRGGPSVGHVDLSVTTTGGETTQVEIVDCLPCVAISGS